MASTILIVEDDKIQLKGLSIFLERSDIPVEIYEASDYNTAAELINSDTVFDIFFLDIMLGKNQPKDAGITLAKKIREISRYINTPIIFITGNSGKMYTAINDIHCYGYLLKPYTEKDVINILKSAVVNQMFTKQIANSGQSTLSIHHKDTLQIRDIYGCQHNIFSKDILYVKNENHNQVIVTKSKSIYTSHFSLENFEKELGEKFVRCHRSYLINPDNVSHFDPLMDTIRISNDNIPIGRTYKKNTVNKLINKTANKQ